MYCVVVLGSGKILNLNLSLTYHSRCLIVGKEDGPTSEVGLKGTSPIDLSIEELIEQFSRRIHIGGKDVYCLPERKQTV